jgi:hypothetical protein
LRGGQRGEEREGTEREGREGREERREEERGEERRGEERREEKKRGKRKEKISPSPLSQLFFFFKRKKIFSPIAPRLPLASLFCVLYV